MKRILLAIISIFIILSSPTYAEESVYKIGAIAPLTGPLHEYGSWFIRGIEMAIDEVNSAGGIKGKQLELFIEDDACVSKNAVTAVKKLKALENISLFFVFCTAVAAPVAQVTAKDSIVITPSFKTTPLEAGNYTHYFSLQPEIKTEMSKLVEHLISTNTQKLAVFTEEDDFCNSYADILVELLKDTKIEVVEDLRIQRNETDLKAYLTKIRSKDADTIFFLFKPHQQAVLLKQFSELKLSAKLVTNWTAQVPFILDFPADLTNGIVYTYHYNQLIPGKPTLFTDKYQANFKVATQVISASMYDAFFIFKQALEKCDSEQNIKCLRSAVANMKEINGASGTFKFSDYSTTKNVLLKTINNQKFQTLQKSQHL
ncbi:MAG: ABC transporter substrate-binding protein [Bdellovibrionota bacterium]